MDFATHSYRWGLEHLHETNPAWVELQAVLRAIKREDVIAAQTEHLRTWMDGKRKNPPTGGQTVINRVIEERLMRGNGWAKQVPVIPAEGGRGIVPYWSMDFLRDQIGVEVSFNNAGVLPQNLLRMSVKAESHRLEPDSMIRLGILIVATADLKAWSQMDSTVHTFEQVKRVLEFVTFSVPTPMVVVGLNPSDDGERWQPTRVFPGSKPGYFAKLTEAKKADWRAVLRAAGGLDGPASPRLDY